jgi:hypothetical protein
MQVLYRKLIGFLKMKTILLLFVYDVRLSDIHAMNNASVFTVIFAFYASPTINLAWHLIAFAFMT